ncbi:L-arabinokinase [Platanthera zijinensis]|uniref:L-arabinokinase n=1 Tax=Platanthera zijinensis TaxID=2320716 RepID=A0AAP0GEI9_9ASPA
MVAHQITVSGDHRLLVFAYYITGHGFGHATRVVDGVCFASSHCLCPFSSSIFLVFLMGEACITDLDEVSLLKPEHAILAYYVTGHGLGHATRVVEIVRHLVESGHVVHVVTAAPEFVFTTDIQSPNLHIRKYLETAVIPRASILATEVEWLKSVKADLVISDVVPVACRAAADAGIRSVCVTNFSWDFIYAEYVMATGKHLRSIVWQIAEDYSHCEFLLRLPGYCPMPAFRDVIDVPLVVRRLHKSRAEVRKELGFDEDMKLVIFNFGGQPAGWSLKKEWLPSKWLCLVAARILQDTAIGKKFSSGKLSGARRLRDAIILGYQLQRSPGRDVSIPEWYTQAENEVGLRSVTPHLGVNDDATFVESYIENFEILHGDPLGLLDTVSFLKSLSALDSEYGSGKNNLKRQLREQSAAAALFNWEEDIFVARAPGRLDVMGGIADYSGSLVLQMPIREACHVAVQRNHPTKHKLWKHAQARQNAKGEQPHPVSFGSELSNRAPTFDMNLSDFMDGEQPISYEKAYKYFAQDPSQKWAAYVAGTILVLMTELGTRFTDSICILLFLKARVFLLLRQWKLLQCLPLQLLKSRATVQRESICPSYEILRTLLSQVENHIVGAPCGVMDQMTSACGEANKLLAMVCQPAEVKELVTIPNHIRFWGLDSGIRHSVGGGDYGSVRIGAFMGRKIIKSEASTLSKSMACTDSTQIVDGMNSEYEEFGIELLKAEASLPYLCNLSTHRYQAVYMKKLPEDVLGERFLNEYGDHNDKVTIIDPKRVYGVQAATKHPIYENFRVETFKALLTSATSDQQLSALGELMYQRFINFTIVFCYSAITAIVIVDLALMERTDSLYSFKKCSIENHLMTEALAYSEQKSPAEDPAALSVSSEETAFEAAKKFSR